LSELQLIVGLGNPGKEYEYTRHNFGFLVLRHIAEKYQLKIRASRDCKGLTAEGQIDKKACCLLFPGTFMNNSGVSIKQMVVAKNITHAKILIICDDVNLDFGQLRIRRRGSDGGHNGLSSVIYHLESEDFARLRVGAGPPKNKEGMVDFVLEEFNKNEKKQLPNIIEEAADCSEAWLTQDVEKIMNQYLPE